MLVGVIADSHINPGTPLSQMPQSVLSTFQDVDLILHLGDVGRSPEALDDLAKLAPLRVIKGGGNNPGGDPRLEDPGLVVDVEGRSIGMTFSLDDSEEDVNFHFKHKPTFTHELAFREGFTVQELVTRRFGRDVDIFLFAASHAPFVGWYDNVLFVNPGSPTLPEHHDKPGEQGTVSPDAGTVAVLDISSRGVVPNIIQLAD
jgi:putative phosphoesterase